jgi:hypothetical protein
LYCPTRRRWFSKHTAKLGLQKRENERLISKLQDRINRTAIEGGALVSLGLPLQTAPLVVLERKLHAARKHQRELEAQDLTRMDVGTFAHGCLHVSSPVRTYTHTYFIEGLHAHVPLLFQKHM